MIIDFSFFFSNKWVFFIETVHLSQYFETTTLSLYTQKDNLEAKILSFGYHYFHFIFFHSLIHSHTHTHTLFLCSYLKAFWSLFEQEKVSEWGREREKESWRETRDHIERNGEEQRKRLLVHKMKNWKEKLKE